VLFAAELCRAGGEVRKVSIDIISPAPGRTVDTRDPTGLPLHVKVHGLKMPQEGYAQILLDGQLVANMEEAELYLVIEDTTVLSRGSHLLTVLLLDAAGEPLGAEKYASFAVMPDGGQGGSGTGGRAESVEMQGQVAGGGRAERESESERQADGDGGTIRELREVEAEEEEEVEAEAEGGKAGEGGQEGEGREPDALQQDFQRRRQSGRGRGRGEGGAGGAGVGGRAFEGWSVSGSALHGGYLGEEVELYIQARDRYGNEIPAAPTGSCKACQQLVKHVSS